MELEIFPLALKKIRLRKIPLEWVKETVNRPDQTRKGYLDRKVCQKIYRRGEKEVIEGSFREGLLKEYCSDGIFNFTYRKILERLRMRIEYDPKHDIMNIEFIGGTEIEESVEFDGVILDYSKDKKIVSMEILDVGKRIEPNVFEEISLTIVKSEAEA